MLSKAKTISQSLILFCLTLVSRIPFLNAGYGAEEDSWGLALAAWQTNTAGVYEVSRFPGHPFQELILSALWGSGPFVYNLLSAFFSAVAVVFFFFILKRLNIQQALLLSFAFALTPVVFVSSTYTIDYMWTEAFVLMSFTMLLDKRFALAGLLLGFAMACRITSGAMLLPFAFWLYRTNNEDWFKRIMIISLVCIATVSMWFIPVVKVYGTEWFMYYDQFPYPSMAKVIYKGLFGVFGSLGGMALMVGVFISFYFLYKKRKLLSTEIINVLLFCLMVMVLYKISYFRLPQKSGYVISLVPFAYIFLGICLTAVQLRVVMLCIILSSLCFSINLTDTKRGATYSPMAFRTVVSGQEIFIDPLTGPVISDYSKRIQKMQYTVSVRQRVSNLPNKTFIIAGWWYNQIMVEALDNPLPLHVVFDGYSNEQKLREYKANGYNIYYLPEQNIYNDLMFGMQVTDSLAKSFE